MIEGFKTVDRIHYFLSVNKGDKGKITELLKVMGFKHKSMFYTRMNSNSWTLEEILCLCDWWDISINEFIGEPFNAKGNQPFLEQRIQALEEKMDAILAR